MNLLIRPSFLYKHTNDHIIDYPKYKSVTLLKTSSTSNILNLLYFSMLNNELDVCKDNLLSFLKDHIDTHFCNEEKSETIEEHIIRHVHDSIIFSINTEDDSVSIKYLLYTKEPQLIEIQSLALTPTERQHCDFVLPEQPNEQVLKNKKVPFNGIFRLFKKKKTEKNSRAEA